jgi:hypothetical protein
MANTAHSLHSLPRGAITEILGETSAGRTAFAQRLLATATQAGEVVAVVDADDAFDPASAKKSGVDLGKLLWVQCAHRTDAALKATDMTLHSGGFGLILLDLCDAPASALNRVPTSTWYRFRRAVENTPAVLLIVAQHSLARSCAAWQIGLRQRRFVWRGAPPFRIVERLEIQANSRKPAPSAPVELTALAEA